MPKDTPDFVWDLLELGLTPHVAQNERGRRSAIEGRMTRHRGCRHSQRQRKQIEGIVTWFKTVGAGDNLRCLRQARNKLGLELTVAACNLTRLPDFEAALA